MKDIRKQIITIACMFFTLPLIAQSGGDKILGVYSVVGETTGEESKVEFYCTPNGCYEARITWLQNPLDKDGNPRLDDLNPDPELRKVRGDKIIVVRDLKYDPDKKNWTGGKIYNPVAGKTFDVMAEFESDKTLKVRGYMGKQILGKNFYWDKIQ